MQESESTACQQQIDCLKFKSIMRLQPISAKLGEIKYRQKIAKQHTDGHIYFKEELNRAEIKKILAQRLKDAKKTFLDLKKHHLLSSPFLEIGAEYSLASTLLKNKFALSGFALDISFHSLKKASYFARVFKFKKVPNLVCADANTLPFKKNSIPFIFSYETLHHFPNPKASLTEIYRVLSPKGLYLIGSDPIKQSLQIKLWRRPTKLRPWEKLLKALLILPFISHIGKAETEFGIIEGGFDLKTWQDSLKIFDQVDAKITLYPFGPSFKMKKDQGKWSDINPLAKSYLFLFGGDLQAICQKAAQKRQDESTQDKEFICPNCLKENGKEITISADFVCPKCQTKYQKYQGVLILLEKMLAQKLSVKSF